MKSHFLYMETKSDSFTLISLGRRLKFCILK